MSLTKRQLENIIPLYSVLSKLVVEFLEPCLDYDVPKCNHKIAWCTCGNTFKFRRPLYPYQAREKRILLEKFCPFCGEANKHNSPDSPKWLHQGWRMKPSLLKITKVLKWKQKIQIKTKPYLNCPHCDTLAESDDHQYCTKCQHKLEWSAWPCGFSALLQKQKKPEEGIRGQNFHRDGSSFSFSGSLK